MIVSSLTIMSVVINFLVILIILLKINRHMDRMDNTLGFLEKKIKEEDVFVVKTNQTVERIEREIKDIEGDIEWKG